MESEIFPANNENLSPIVPKEILAHYDLGNEAVRLESPFCWLERIRTEDLLRRFLPAPPSVIADIGGAAGVYALPLSAKGYDVELLDAVPLHINQAKASSEKQGGQGKKSLRSARVGDARALPYATESFDAVLLLGPLYHLPEHNDRIRALREAFRVLRPGGVIFAAGISSFASLLDGLTRGFFKEEIFFELVKEDLQTGQHRNETDNPDYFTTAFLHHPDRLRIEVQEAGFRVEALVGIEGPVWSPADFDYWSKSDSNRERLLGLLRQVETEPSLVGASAHIMAIARK